MRNLSSLLIFSFLFVLTACAATNHKTTFNASAQTAPDFTLSDQDGKLWKLSDAVKKIPRGGARLLSQRRHQTLNTPVC